MAEVDELSAIRKRLDQIEAQGAESVRLINQHAEVINVELKVRSLDARLVDFLSQFEALLDKQFENAQTYTTIVIGGAYAGLFALWTFLKGISPDRVLALSGILILVSMSLFVLWEVLGVFLRGLQQYAVTKLQKPTTPDEIQQYMDTVNAAMKRRQASVGVWIVVFACSLVSGLAAAGILLFSMAKEVILVG